VFLASERAASETDRLARNLAKEKREAVDQQKEGACPWEF